jgi:hypothetical protein
MSAKMVSGQFVFSADRTLFGSPPSPPFSRGGMRRVLVSVPPLEKGGLGGDPNNEPTPKRPTLRPLNPEAEKVR